MTCYHYPRQQYSPHYPRTTGGPFRPGDRVRIYPRGLPMRVVSVGHNTVGVEWRSNGELCRGSFERDRLEVF